MNKKDLDHIGRFLYGGGWQTALAKELDVNIRTMRRWVSGETDIPFAVADEIYSLAAEIQANRALDVINFCHPRPEKVELKIKPSGNVQSMHDRSWSVVADREILTRVADILRENNYLAEVK